MGLATSRSTVTVADICQAITNQELPAEKRGQWYVVRRRDVLAFAYRLVSQKRLTEPKMAS
ncbi:MAG: hypothetical protein ACUVX1_03350 [Chloroflexota bacterium]